MTKKFKFALVSFLIFSWFFSFTPLVQAQSAGPVTIVAAGDIACSSDQSTDSECHQKQTSELVEQLNPNAVLTLGDNQYLKGEYSDFLQFYDKTWGKFKKSTYPVAGNHEYKSPKASGYFEYFGKAAGDPNKGYYSFNLGDWHLIALNSSCQEVNGCYYGSDQEVWLRNDLSQNQQTCTLAYWHEPRFSSGVVHGSRVVFQPFWRALYEYKADVVLSGHDHEYERFAPQDPNGKPDTQGIREFVVGTGGFSLYKFGVPLATSEVRNNSSFGVLKLTLNSDNYSWQFIGEDSRVLDSGIGSCLKGALGSETRNSPPLKTIWQLLPAFLVLLIPPFFIIFLEILERKGIRKPKRDK